MVFYFKCYPFSFWEQKNETRDQTKSTSVDGTFYTAVTDIDGKYSRAILDSQNDSYMSSSLAVASLPERPIANNLRVFTYAELKSATKNFSPSSQIGEGGFGRVYRGVIKSLEYPFNKIVVAVKVGERGLMTHRQWLTEVQFLGKIEHPNLVKLIGYSEFDESEFGYRFLVYEYMPNRSLDYHLWGGRRCAPLPWSMRLKVAYDVACGLAYLHSGMDYQVIFRDLKPSNILLDEQWNAKLSDFGFARLGPSGGETHVSTRVVGTMGYTAPEYNNTGHLTSNSDVWSYGVLLLVLITGRRPLIRSLPKNEQSLLEWVKSHLGKKFSHIVDSRIQDNCPLQSVARLLNIASGCLSQDGKLRPKMTHVSDMLNQLITEFLLQTTHPSVPLVTSQGASDPAEVSGEDKTCIEMKLKGKRRSGCQDGQGSQKKSSLSWIKKASALNKSSPAELYHSAHTDSGVRPVKNLNDLEVFTYLELKQATGNFNLSSRLGEGEFGPVYKAVITYPYNKCEVAVKHLLGRHSQGDDEWVTEVNSIGLVHHPNLVKLVGYCVENNESGRHRLLVYEYVCNGSVKDRLSAQAQSEAPLSWDVRLQVAQDAAFCLAFLHQAMNSKVLFGKFKSSNVLLDDQWHAKLSGRLVGRLCPSEEVHHISSMAIENIGCEAPEYQRTGNATSKSDVWSYGVFIYELITGRLPFDLSLPKNEQKLVEWVKPYLNSEKLGQIIDPRLQGHYSLQSVEKLSTIANLCLAKNPELRPKMTDVVSMITAPVIEATHTLVTVHTSEEASNPQKACEENKDKGQRRFNNGVCGCLPRVCPLKR